MDSKLAVDTPPISLLKDRTREGTQLSPKALCFVLGVCLEFCEEVVLCP